MREIRIWQEGGKIIICDQEFHYIISDSFLNLEKDRPGLLNSPFLLEKAKCERGLCDFSDCRKYPALKVDQRIAFLFLLFLRLLCGED